mgnify:FL=1
MIKVINYLSGINVSCVFKERKTKRMPDGDIYSFNIYTLSNGYEIREESRLFVLLKKGRRQTAAFYEDDFVEQIQQIFEAQK